VPKRMIRSGWVTPSRRRTISWTKLSSIPITHMIQAAGPSPGLRRLGSICYRLPLRRKRENGGTRQDHADGISVAARLGLPDRHRRQCPPGCSVRGADSLSPAGGTASTGSRSARRSRHGRAAWPQSRFRLPFGEMRTQLRPDSLTGPFGQVEKRPILSGQQLREVSRIANLDSERTQHSDALCDPGALHQAAS
jgi:hypothetical protein